MKNTKSRNLILTVLNGATKPLTAEEIYKDCINENINLSTIYRNLNTFAKNKIVKKEINKDGSAYFSLNSSHHHYLECLNCHEKIELKDCPFESIHKKIKSSTGFTIDDENTIIYGTCKKCKEENNK